MLQYMLFAHDFFRKQLQNNSYIIYRFFRKPIFLIILATVLFALVVYSHSESASVYGNVSSSQQECYESVYVKAGDCLWSISNRYYSREYKDIRRYMKRIMKINHMETTDVKAGTYLLVPYYVET